MSTRRQQFARGACRTLLWTFGFFALFQLLLSLVLEFCWTRARDPFYGPKVARLKDRLRAQPDARLAVMVGSSRTGNGLRAAPCEADLARQLGQPLVVFNFGMPGAGPPTQLLQLQRLLAEGIKPDLLLVEVLPALLDDRMGADTQRLAAERLSWSDLEQVRRYPLQSDSLGAAWREARLVPWYAHRFNILSTVLPTMLPIHLRQDGYARCDECGWGPASEARLSPEQTQRLRDRAFHDYQPILESFRLGTSSSRALRMILEECRRHHIKAALVLMPEGPYFRDFYSAQVWQQVDPFLEGLSREYAAPVINARCWFGEENFIDSHHLAAAGATRFSERLGREVIVPLLR